MNSIARLLCVGTVALASSLGGAIAADTQAISASDSRIAFDGRFDFSATNAPTIIWQASRIQFDFDGNTVGLKFEEARGQNFFNAQVDASNSIVAVSEGRQPNTVTLAGFGEGRHHLTLFKRSEAKAGTVCFRGIELPAAASLWPPASATQPIKMEFIGDSITVGACNEDGAEDQWENRRTHNAARSYAAVTAEAFSADYRNIAVSGMGVVTGWVNITADEIWNRIYPDPSSPREDPKAWVPQVLFVNLGENDDSFTRSRHEAFPTNYTRRYVALVHAIRDAWPAAEIVLLRGGMYGGANSEPLRVAWESTCQQLEADDPRISHYVFQHWTRNHPRVADDQAMADELVTWLKGRQFMAPHRP
jgi:lysophospholipase L1-like esterase